MAAAITIGSSAPPLVGELEGEHHAGQWRAHYAAEDRGQSQQCPESWRDRRKELAHQRAERSPDHEGGRQYSARGARPKGYRPDQRLDYEDPDDQGQGGLALE